MNSETTRGRYRPDGFTLADLGVPPIFGSDVEQERIIFLGRGSTLDEP